MRKLLVPLFGILIAISVLFLGSDDRMLVNASELETPEPVICGTSATTATMLQGAVTRFWS